MSSSEANDRPTIPDTTGDWIDPDLESFRNAEQTMPLLNLLGCRLLDREEPDVITVEMRNDQSTQNHSGSPHGGALATLADHAGGIAAALLTGRGGPTVDLHIRFLARATGPRVFADCRLLRSGRRLNVTDVRIYDDSRRLLATASVTTAPMDGTSASPD